MYHINQNLPPVQPKILIWFLTLFHMGEGRAGFACLQIVLSMNSVRGVEEPQHLVSLLKIW